MNGPFGAFVYSDPLKIYFNFVLQDQLMQLSPTECEDVEIRNEISQLKQRLAGTDQELQRTNHTLRLLLPQSMSKIYRQSPITKSTF